MDMALLIAKSGLDAHHKNIEVISNNLANSNTASFKKNRAQFEDLPYDVISQAGSPISQDINAQNNLALGTGTRLSANKKIFSDGAPIQTDNPLNIAIRGNGFMKVQLPSGDYAYTRDGNLQPNESGQLVMGRGYVVQPPITIPSGYQQLVISKDGIVSASANGSNELQQLGQIQLTTFINPDGLIPVGENLYQSTAASTTGSTSNPMSNGAGEILQNFLEGSNVNVVEEMVSLIEAQRAFEVTSKAVSAVDGMLQNLAREI